MQPVKVDCQMASIARAFHVPTGGNPAIVARQFRRDLPTALLQRGAQFSEMPIRHDAYYTAAVFFSHSAARFSSNARSRSLRVNDAARSNSARASW